MCPEIHESLERKKSWKSHTMELNPFFYIQKQKLKRISLFKEKNLLHEKNTLNASFASHNNENKKINPSSSTASL